MKNQYVNNAEFLRQIVVYLDKVKEAEAVGDEPPRIPNTIGKCIYDIATRLSQKPNFINYPFREEMIGDGIENAIKCIGNFNPEKSSNPFAYFTQVIWFAFLRRIQSEKKVLYIKHKVLEKEMLHINDNEEFTTTITMKPTDYMNEFVKTYEENMEEKKKKEIVKRGLEKFYEES